MNIDLQKASMWKRISAFLFDTILLVVVVSAFALFLSMALGYDKHNETLEQAYAKYEEKYGITFDITEEEYNRLTAEEVQRYDDAYAMLIADEKAMYSYNMVINLTLVITSVSILIAFILMEFVAPLFLGNGQTLGKKIFGLCLMRTDGIQINAPLLFIRTILGKYTVETMIPILILIMLFFNMIGILGTLILALILLLQIVLLIVTRTNSMIHDLLAKTVVVDYASQKIFKDADEMIAYTKKKHAEKAAQTKY